MPDVTPSPDVNRDLRDRYLACFPTLLELSTRYEKLNWPHLLRVPDGFHLMPVRLMVVGQQTAGWGKGAFNNLDQVLDRYEKFNFGNEYRATPFWRASRLLHEAITAPTGTETFLWTNIFKFAQSKRRPQPEVRKACLSLRLLETEIEVTEPNVIMFFTGPRYDCYLLQMFPGLPLP